MLQPTGPQEGAGAYDPPPPDPVRVAAGRDICREIDREAQPGQASSASSDFRMISSSKTLPQPLQEYS
jgi:hypothetical protein